jgi:release factor glutamine methyltransferase
VTADIVTAEVTAELRAAGCVFAEEEARLLVETAGSAGELAAMVRRRRDGEPLEHILGWAEFRGLRIAVAPGVFVPRRRSELLVRLVTSIAPPGPIVVDLCCGSGAIGTAILAATPGATVHATDIDPVAVGCAAGNLTPYGGHAYAGDLYDALPVGLRGTVDVIVANAPYVPHDEIALMPPEARDHEPRTALDGGADGLDIQRRIAASAREWLAPGGHVVLETSRRQSDTTEKLLRDKGFSTSVHHDPELDGTAVVGRLT